VEKCTELGVRRVIPLAAKRCERGSARLNLVRLRRIALEAAKQAGRSWIPEIAPVADIKSVCRGGGVLRPDLKGAELRVGEALARFPAAEWVTMLIGPEGDFTAMERVHMAGLGVVPVNLGGLTLRAETAAIAATALIVSAVP
jgi:16S rRNA (uracil1498-N3)-methyltransferase